MLLEVSSADPEGTEHQGGLAMLNSAFTIQKMLLGMKQHSASDLHIKVGVAPTYRINGVLRAIGSGPLDAEEADHLLDPIVPDILRNKFVERGDLDFATFNSDGDRFRVNMYRAGGHVAAAIRRVKAEIPSYAELNLPEIYSDLISKSNEGLILVVGITGSGKSSTLVIRISASPKSAPVTECCPKEPLAISLSVAV